MSTSSPKIKNIFYCYAHESKDEELRDELEKHLKQLSQVRTWHAGKVLPGTDQEKEINIHLNEADIILLLISADFLASEDCLKQATQALERWRASGVTVIPILLRPVNLKGTPFDKLRSLPTNGEPVTIQPNQDRAFANIAAEIQRTAERDTSDTEFYLTEEQNTYTVFLSYANADSHFVKRLAADLQKQGIIARFDQQRFLSSEADKEETIRAAICTARAVLLPSSPHTRNSRHVRGELYIAEIYRRPIYPLWIDGDQWTDAVPRGRESMWYTDARTNRYEFALREIVTILQTSLSALPSQEIEQDFEPRNPYKGLNAFLEEDAPDFFGRDAVIIELADHLKNHLAANEQDTTSARLVAIIGPSGSGKSSVVMAGLIPYLHEGGVFNSAQWIYLNRITPGQDPLEALVSALSEKFPERSSKMIRQDLLELEEDSTRGLHLLATRLMKQRRTKVVLVIDQFEELFSLTSSQTHRQLFIDLLLTAVTERDGPVIAILTLRGDFYDRLTVYPGLAQIVKKQHLLMPPMNVNDLRTVIEKPAAMPDVGLTFEGDLVGDLIFEMREHIGVLPLLQFSLEQLFLKRQGHLLTLQAYQEIGGVQGALAQHAEKTYNSLPPEYRTEPRDFSRALFIRLLNLGTIDQDVTRRRASRAEFNLDDPTQTRLLQNTIEKFISERLLTISQVNEVPLIEISHEALIREWERLQGWIRSAREDIQLQQTIGKNAASWERYHKQRDRLYRGSQLREAKAWAARNIPNSAERAFLHASTAYQRTLYLRIAIIGALILLLSLPSIVLLQQFFRASVTTKADNGSGSLRAAIANATDGSVITFDAHLKGGTITLTQEDLNIGKNITIVGPGANQLIISAGNSTPRIRILPHTTVTISGLSFQNNPSDYMVTNDGTLFLNNCTVMNNGTKNKLSGAVSNYEGTMTVDNSTISGNIGQSGAISNIRGTATLIHSTVSYNMSNGIVNDGGVFIIKDSTISHNTTTDGNGGGISNTHTLVLNNSSVEHNTAVSGGGIFTSGGIFTMGTTNVINSSILQNTATHGDGGGLANNGGSTTLTDSVVAENGTLAGNGGGIANSSLEHSRSKLLLVNSTISENQAAFTNGSGGYGGGIFNRDGQANITFCTIYDNKATESGGGIDTFQTTPSPSSQVILQTSIVARDSAAMSPDTSGAIKSAGYNLLTTNANTTISGGTNDKDIIDPNFQLLTLQQNGGPTLTYAISRDSPARRRIPQDICQHLHVSTDQRGVKRPQDVRCDIGAYQYT